MNMAFLLAVAQLLLAVFGSWGYMLLHCRPNEKRAISNFSRIGFYRREWIRDSIAMLNYMEILLLHSSITRNSNKVCNTWKTDTCSKTIWKFLIHLNLQNYAMIFDRIVYASKPCHFSLYVTQSFWYYPTSDYLNWLLYDAYTIYNPHSTTLYI